MVTIYRGEGLQVVIFVDDHEPAHIHVFGDGQAKINLTGLDEVPELVWADAMKRATSGAPCGSLPNTGRCFWRDARRSMAELNDADIDAALARGRALRATEPRAARARYDRAKGRLVLDLTNGCTFAFPARMAQGLSEATDDQLAAVEILGNGYGLHWEALDTDISVPGLLAGIFGTSAYMARLAGQSKSPAKAAASRANGAKGGRPRKAAASR